jgi:hypothetical protein
MPSSTLRCLASISFVKTPLTRIPIAIIADSAVIKLALDQDVADIAVILGIHLNKAMLPLAIACLSLRETVATDVIVAAVALLAMRVGTADGLVADVAIETDVPGGIFDEVSEVFCAFSVALLCFAFVCVIGLAKNDK